MPIVADDGRGATLTLAGSAWETNTLITSITCDPATREALDTSHLGTTTSRTFIAADLADNGGFSVEFIADQLTNTGGTPATFSILSDAANTTTITYSPTGSSTNGATIVGSAFCVEYSPPSATVGELKKGSAKFKWAGNITFTGES